MQRFLREATDMKPEIAANRRIFHGFAEVGFDLSQTKKQVFDTLVEYGYQPQYIGISGVIATAGKPGKTILLRADMDALPMKEESGLDFASENGNCHSCGHDLHTSMLLGAAKLLKQHEAELEGTVKLMFQPAEELLSGARDMIQNGVLENPKVDAALALHVMAGLDNSQVGNLCYTKGAVCKSGDAIRVEIKGKDAHGSTPNHGVDAITIAAHIVIALQEIIAREIPSAEDIVLLVGKIEGGTTCNSVAGYAALDISIRTCGKKQREFIKQRIEAIATGITTSFRGEVEIKYLYGSPALENDSKLVDELTGYIHEIIDDDKFVSECKMTGGEDFALIAEQVPSAFFLVGAGSVSQGHTVSLHNPSVMFNEDVLPLGSAIYAGCAKRWLEQNA